MPLSRKERVHQVKVWREPVAKRQERSGKVIVQRVGAGERRHRGEALEQEHQACGDSEAMLAARAGGDAPENRGNTAPNAAHPENPAAKQHRKCHHDGGAWRRNKFAQGDDRFVADHADSAATQQMLEFVFLREPRPREDQMAESSASQAEDCRTAKRG